MQAPGHNSGAPDRRKSTRLAVYKFMHATVTLSPPVSTEQTEQNQSAQHWTGLLADISPKGAQVILPPDFEKHFRQDQQVNIRIKTILENIDFNVTAEVKYVTKAQVHDSVQIGVHFTGLASNSRAEYEIMRLTKYADKLQASTDTQAENIASAED